jgi:endo-1,3-1,4-beta-glycanase ExoK
VSKLLNTQQKPATAHTTTGDDALIVSCLVALCCFGIFMLSDFDSPKPAETMTTAAVEVTVPDDVSDSQPIAPAIPPSSPVPATPAPTPSHTLIPPAKTRPTLPSAPGFITLLGDTLNDAFFYRSEYSNPTGHYGGDWSRDNIGQTAEGADLDVRRHPSRSGPYTGGEMKTLKTYGYGRYEVVMRPAKGSGLVSSFFTYTGAYEGNPHDEIDIEFLGLDTSRIHFNYFRNGKTGESATFDLPFDAAEADHLYAFEWAPEGITWYVDGEPYYKTVEGDAYLPTTPGSVIFNAWTGKPFMSAWHGKPTFESGAAAHYSCVSFSPMGEETRACSDLFLARRPSTSHALTAQLSQQPTP